MTIMKNLSTNISIILKASISFLLKDFAFIIMPLCVVIIANVFLQVFSFSTILYSSNFSFVVLTMLSVSLSNFLEHKIKKQNDLSSKLFDGTKMILIPIIISVLILVFTLIIESKTVNLSINIFWVEIANVILFIYSLFWLFMLVLVKEIEENESNDFSKPKESKIVMFYLEKSIAKSNKNISYALFALNNFKVKEKNTASYNESQLETISKIEGQINNLQRSIAEIKNKFEERKAEL